MSFKRFAAAELAAMVVFFVCSSSIVGAASVRSVTVFAEGAAVKATGPDSIAVTDDAIWVSYTNGADSTGLSGSSTVVEHSLSGRVQRTSGQPFQYAAKSSTRGYDDVVFRGNRTFLSYTNPASLSDATIQLLVKDSNPLRVTTILTMGATGTNLATGQPNQPTTQNDPDSLKLTPFGDLQLSSGADGQIVFVAHPGTDEQAVSFLTLLDPSSGQPVSNLDDAVFATAPRGVFYLADTGNNRILAIKADDLEFGSLFASVGSVKALVSVDLKSGRVSTFVGGLNGPHGLVFLPQREDGEEDRR
jgi:hypothetical protein